MSTTTRTVISVIAALVIPASFALALGFELGESKDKDRPGNNFSNFTCRRKELLCSSSRLDTHQIEWDTLLRIQEWPFVPSYIRDLAR